jgi:hypothetical protein
MAFNLVGSSGGAIHAAPFLRGCGWTPIRSHVAQSITLAFDTDDLSIGVRGVLSNPAAAVFRGRTALRLHREAEGTAERRTGVFGRGARIGLSASRQRGGACRVTNTQHRWRCGDGFHDRR